MKYNYINISFKFLSEVFIDFDPFNRSNFKSRVE